MDVLKIAVLGIAGIMLGMTIRQLRPEYALYISLAVSICILIYATGKLSYLLETMAKIKTYIPVDDAYLNTLLKMIGITYVGQFSSGLCKDAGYGAIAGQIEIFSKLSILVISMPILLALLETIQGILS